MIEKFYSKNLTSKIKFSSQKKVKLLAWAESQYLLLILFFCQIYYLVF